jgi:hypothetical protein
MGLPFAFTSTRGSSPIVRAPGFTMQEPTLPPGVANVDFARLHADLFHAFPANHKPIAAFSTGTEVININADTTISKVEGRPEWQPAKYPVLVVGGHGWFTILFNVKGSLPATPDPNLDGTIAPAVANATDRGRILFSATIPVSYEQLDGPLHYLPAEQDTVPALLAPHLGLQVGEQLRGVDLIAALHKTDLKNKASLRSRLPAAPTIYFTLGADFIASVPASMWREVWEIEAERVSTAVVFRSMWSGERWQRPVVHATVPRLNLGTDHEIDGLAIDTTQAKQLMLLSTTNAPNVDLEIQLVIAAGEPQPVLVKRGPAYRSLGRDLRAGRAIGDFCTADPWLVAPGGIVTYAEAAAAMDVPDDFMFARRQQHSPPQGSTDLPISAIRTWHDGQLAIKVCMSKPANLAAGTVELYWGYTNDVRTGVAEGDWTVVVLGTPSATAFDHTLIWPAPRERTDGPFPGIACYWTLTDGATHYSHVATIRAFVDPAPDRR